MAESDLQISKIRAVQLRWIILSPPLHTGQLYEDGQIYEDLLKKKKDQIIPNGWHCVFSPRDDEYTT